MFGPATMINSWDLTSGETITVGALIAVMVICSIVGQDPSDSKIEQCFRWFSFVLGILFAIAAVLVIK